MPPSRAGADFGAVVGEGIRGWLDELGARRVRLQPDRYIAATEQVAVTQNA